MFTNTSLPPKGLIMPYQIAQPTTASSWKLLAAIIIFAAVNPSILMTAPAIASQLASQWQLNELQIHYLFMAELGAMSLATLPAYWWLSHCNWRTIAMIAGVIFCLGNLASFWAANYHLLMLCRFITASAGGALMILCISSASYTNNPSRIYGFWVLGQLALGAIDLLILPHLFKLFGLQAVYLLLTILMLLCLPLTQAFPSGILVRSQDYAHTLKTTKVSFLTLLLSVLAVLLFYVGLSGIWTFISKIAEQIVHISPAKTGEILSIATVLGIVGAATATFIGNRFNRTLLLWLGYGAMVSSVTLLLGIPSIIRFIVAAFIFKFTWTFVLPFILATVSELDQTGKLMNTINLVIGGGMAIGPAIAGFIIKDLGGIDHLIAFAVTMLMISMGLILFIKSNHNNKSEE